MKPSSFQGKLDDLVERLTQQVTHTIRQHVSSERLVEMIHETIYPQETAPKTQKPKRTHKVLPAVSGLIQATKEGYTLTLNGKLYRSKRRRDLARLARSFGITAT
jgi:hypothetical protein